MDALGIGFHRPLSSVPAAGIISDRQSCGCRGSLDMGQGINAGGKPRHMEFRAGVTKVRPNVGSLAAGCPALLFVFDRGAGDSDPVLG